MGLGKRIFFELLIICINFHNSTWNNKNFIEYVAHTDQGRETETVEERKIGRYKDRERDREREKEAEGQSETHR